MRLTYSAEQAYYNLINTVAKSYGVRAGQVIESFSVPELMEQRLNEAVQASSAFLQRINVVGVTDVIGQNVVAGVNTGLAKRTDTSSKDRKPDNHELDGIEYRCYVTEFDYMLTYALLDAWSRDKTKLLKIFSNSVTQRMALDRIKIGFYGKTAAKETNRTTNKNLEDVNIGWIKLLETYNATNYLKEGATPGKIKIGSGSGSDFKNLDQLTYDVYSMISEDELTGSEVAIVGRELVANDMNENLAKIDASNKEHIQLLNKSYGTLPAAMVPGFPKKGLLVSDLKNLSIYWQKGSTRRRTIDNAARSRIDNFISSNEAYMLENTKAISGIEADNVEFVK